MSQAEIVTEYLTVNTEKTPIFIPKIIQKVTSTSPNLTLSQISTTSLLSNTIVNNNSLQIDWRTKNIISGVKNQGICGGCWAFAAVAQI